jgi:hypothetical protein
MLHLSTILSKLIAKQQKSAFLGIIDFSNTLLEKELQIGVKIERRMQAKIFYQWFDNYFR